MLLKVKAIWAGEYQVLTIIAFFGGYGKYQSFILGGKSILRAEGIVSGWD